MYKFPLAAVLNHRKFLEDKLKKDLSLLKKELHIATNRLSELKDQNQKLATEIKTKLELGIVVSELQFNIEYKDKLLMEIDNQEKMVDQIAAKVNMKLSEVIEGMQNRRTLEKLEEKGLKSYRQLLLNKERSFIDEMASVRFNKEM
jgi:flagellar export protein FliJ